jgi:hypothetical protein
VPKDQEYRSMTREEIIKSTNCPVCKSDVGMACVVKRGGKLMPRPTVHPARANMATGGKFNHTKKKKRKSSLPPVLIGKEFYLSWEWKAARFEAIKRHGRRCQCCGWTPGCGGSYLVVDHIKPLRTHPHLALAQSNMQVLCNDCNMGKSWRHTDDFR